jgi:sjoegren syndrome nuclear autoantigen 1
MSAQSATLSNYNNEMGTYLENLTKERQEMFNKVEEDKALYEKLMNEKHILEKKITKIKKKATAKNEALREFDKAIKETEVQFMAILSSSQNLLKILKSNTENLNKQKNAVLVNNFDDDDDDYDHDSDNNDINNNTNNIE